MGKTYSYSVKYRYDEASRLISANYDQNRHYRYAYDAAGNLIKVEFTDTEATAAPPADTAGGTPPQHEVPAGPPSPPKGPPPAASTGQASPQREVPPAPPPSPIAPPPPPPASAGGVPPQPQVGAVPPPSPKVPPPAPPPASGGAPPPPPPAASAAPAQARVWHMSRQGRQFGPYTWEQLRQFAREGRLQANDLVWHPNLPRWTRAGTLNELFK